MLGERVQPVLEKSPVWFASCLCLSLETSLQLPNSTGSREIAGDCRANRDPGKALRRQRRWVHLHQSDSVVSLNRDLPQPNSLGFFWFPFDTTSAERFLQQTDTRTHARIRGGRGSAWHHGLLHMESLWAVCTCRLPLRS